MLIIGGVVILLLALGFLTFDDWLWSGGRKSGEVIGQISDRTGDVRLKYDGEVKWQKAKAGENLMYNDTIFSGANSKADLKLGNSNLQVAENTLVVLRRQDNARFLNLNYGKLLGRIAKDDKILIDTGDGKTAILSSKSGSEIVLEKKDGKTELKVTKGEAELISHNGKKQTLTTRSRAVVEEEAPRAPATPEPAFSVRTITPKSGEPIYSKDPISEKFEWAYDGKPAVEPHDRFQIEFSQTPDFQSLFAVKTIDGRTSEMVAMENSQDVYYRVRGPKNELSQIEKLSFVRMTPPVIITPVKDSVYMADPKQPAEVVVEYQDQFGRPQFMTQIASDPEFKNLIVNEQKPELKNPQNLPSGAYYLRAAADFGNGRASDWTETVPFQVKDKPVLKLTRIVAPPVPSMHFDSSAIIVNKDYPENLYSASNEDVQKYLAEKEGFLNNYFAPIRSSSDDIVIDTMDGSTPTPTAYNWPARSIYPGSQRYRYQVIKKGQKPSGWSNQERLDIALEPPHQTSLTVDTAKLSEEGKAPATIGFSRVLFAKQYEVQMAHQPDFGGAKSVIVKNPAVTFTASDEKPYYFRARALDAAGKPISDFSRSEQVDPGPQILQARNERDKRRAPAATNTIATTQESVLRRTFEHWRGYWAWAGTGANYTSYTQTVKGVGNFDSHDIEPAGAYLEFGWGNKLWAGIFSYKNTPGIVNVSNATVNGGKFQWQTVSGEGMYCPIEPFTIFGKPANLGLRAGLQYQNMPFATVAASGTALNVSTISMINASVGATLEWARDRWRYYWTMRYQYPLSISSAGTTASSTLAFDGSLGAAYYLNDHWKVGGFWYGQWQQFQFTTSLGGTTNTGSQMLFYSALDLRLGYDF